MSLAVQINKLVEQLPKSEQMLVLEIVKRFIPDDMATPDDLADIAKAREEYRRGKTVNHNDIDWS